MSDVDRVFRENLLRLRVQRGLTQQVVADLMQARGFGWHQPTVYKVEAGQRTVLLAEACALVGILRTDLVSMTRSVPVLKAV